MDWEKWTDLALASYLGLNEVVQDILFKENADVNMVTKDRNGSTPLYYATYKGHEAVVKLLVEKGAVLNKEYEDRWFGVRTLSAIRYF